MPKAPKPTYVTIEDFDSLKAELVRKIEDTSGQIAPSVAACEGRLKGALQALTDKVDRGAQEAEKARERLGHDSKSYTDQSAKNVRQQVGLEAGAAAGKQQEALQQLNARVTKVDEEIRADTMKMVQELATSFEEELNARCEEINGSMRGVSNDSAAARAKQREEIDRCINDARKEGTQQTNLLKEHAAAELRRTQELINKQLDDQADGSRLMRLEIFKKLDRHDELLSNTAETAEEHLLEVEKRLGDALEKFRSDTEASLRHLTTESDRFRNAAAEVENVSTRRVDWVIQNVSKQIRPNSASKASPHRSWFSPQFSMSGLNGLQLELQIFRPSDPPSEGEAVGDAGVYLWACKGSNLVFRLYVGDKYQTFENVFGGRAPHGASRLCFLKDHVNRNDDTLRVSVEILEAHREVEHIIETPSDAEEVSPAIEVPEKPLGGCVQFHRHVNNRLFDQVKNQVDLMKSRMMRKVQWRVEQASRLRICFPPGKALCSTQFNACGIEGLQLLFYPSGYSGATDGFCSLFFYGPAGNTVRCQLRIGSQQREVSHSFDESGACGRTNFCRFDSIVNEADDSILIGLEMDEVQHDLVAQASHSVVKLGDRRSHEQADSMQTNPVHSIVKLQGGGGKQGGFEEVRVLPSLWTATFHGSILPHAPPEGTHTFDELRAHGRRGPRRGAGCIASPETVSSQALASSNGNTVSGGVVASGSFRTSESAPLLREGVSPADDAGGGAGASNLTPLPRLGRTSSDGFGGSFGGDGVTAGKPRRQRRGYGSTSAVGMGVATAH
eukprot:TRINITY_DN18284_c0_g1_i2.p1 TRINITY_DN18284_c0_g1~~TRINITY_DN18284_c0_g1_i2.p1  ORF type:complete len:785 (-),score=138.01 TRINITY_DN18284_c0_g1_i2:667-3021(-)